MLLFLWVTVENCSSWGAAGWTRHTAEFLTFSTYWKILGLLFFSMQIIYCVFLMFRTVRSFILSFSALCSAYFSSSLSFSCQPCLCWDIWMLEDSNIQKGPEAAAFLKWAKWFRSMTLIWDFYFLTKTVTTIAHCSLSVFAAEGF